MVVTCRPAPVQTCRSHTEWALGSTVDPGGGDASTWVRGCHESPTPVPDVDDGGGCVGGVGGEAGVAGALWEISVPSAQFCRESRMALKSKVY